MITTLQLKPKYWGAYESLSIHSRSSILTPYLLKATVTLENTTFADRGQLWLLPAFFIELNSGFTPLGAEPQTGYFIEIPSDISFPSTYEMPLKSKSGQSKLVNYNRNCTVTFTSATVAEIVLDFQFLADRGQYLNDTVYDSRELALKANTFSANELFNDIPSIYNRTVDLGAYVYYKSLDDNDDEEFSDNELVLQSRFYNEGLRINPKQAIQSKYTIKTLEIKDEDDNIVTELNPYSDFTFKVTITAVDAPLYGFIYLFPDRTEFEETQPVHEELPLLEVSIEERLGTANVAGAIYEPTTGFVPNGSDYDIIFTVRGSELLPNTSYFAALVIANDTYCETLLQKNIKSGNRPSLYPELPSLYSVITDYHGSTGSNNLRATVVDRYAVLFGFDAVAYEILMKQYNYSNGDALSEIQSVRVELFDKVTNQLYESATARFDGDNLITLDNDLTLVELFPNPVFKYNLRSLFKNEQNFENYANRILRAVVTIEFGYTATQDQVFYKTESEVKVRDFDNFNADALITQIQFLDPDTDAEVLDLSTYTKNTLKVKSLIDPVNAGITDDFMWKHHIFIDAYPFGVNQLSDQQLVGQQQYAGEFDTETNIHIPIQDENFDATTNIATAIIDVSNIDFNVAKNLYVVAKPLPEYLRGEAQPQCYTRNQGLRLIGEYDASIEKYIGTLDYRFAEETADTLGRFNFSEEYDNFYASAFSNYNFQSGGAASNTLPFVVFVNIKRTGSENYLKAEFVEVDPNGDQTVIATTGTVSNSGPFQPDVDESFDSQWYLFDDTDLNVSMPSRIEEFENEWNVHFHHKNLKTIPPEGSPLTQCQYTLEQQRLETINLEKKGYQPIWFAYDPDKIDQGYSYFLRFRGTSEAKVTETENGIIISPKNHVSARLINCNFSSLCPNDPIPTQLSYNELFIQGLMRVNQNVNDPNQYNWSSNGGASSTPDTSITCSDSVNNTTWVFSPQILETGNCPGTLNTQGFSGKGATVDETIALSALRERLTFIDANSYPIVSMIKAPNDNLDGNRIFSLKGTNIYNSGAPLNPWYRLTINYQNTGALPPIDVTITVYQGASVTRLDNLNVALTAGTIFFQETLALGFNGTSPITTRTLNLVEGEIYQFALTLNDGANDSLLYFEMPAKKQP